MDGREHLQGHHFTPTVSSLVEIQPHPFSVQIDQICGAAAVDISQQQSFGIKQLGMVEQGRVVHRHLRPEAPVAEIRPVADLAAVHAGADAHYIRLPITAHVRQVDAFGSIGEHHPWPLLLLPRQRHPLGALKPLLLQGAVPYEHIALTNQQVGRAVTIEIDEVQVGVAEVDVRYLAERAERLPALGAVVLIDARQWSAEIHHIRQAISGQIKDLGPGRQAHVRLAGHCFQRREGGHIGLLVAAQPLAHRAEVALVEPSPRVLRQDPRRSLTMQIHPAVVGAIEADRQVFEAGGIHEFHCLAHGGLAIAELQRWQRFGGDGAALLLPPPLHHLAEEAVNGFCGERGVDLVVVGELGAAHHALVTLLSSPAATGGLIRDVVQHQHPLTAAARAHLEATAVAGEGIRAVEPGLHRGAGGVGFVQLPVVEAHLEQPIGGGVAWGSGQIAQAPGALTLGIEKRLAVAVEDAVQVALGGARRCVSCSSVALMGGQKGIDLAGPQCGGAIFRFVEVADAVALVVAAFADQPAEDPLRIIGIRDAAVGIGAVDREDVVLGDRAPVHIGALLGLRARV